MTASRPLGFTTLFFLGLNGVVGVGIFFLPATVARLVGAQASLGVFALTALLLSPIAACFVLLSGRFAHDGGPILYAHHAFGRTAAFGLGWVVYASAVCSTAATLTGLAQALLPPSSTALTSRGVSAALFTVLMALAAGGLTLSARVWSLLAVAKMVPLAGLLVLAATSPLPGARVLETAAPPFSAAGWASACLAALFALQGFEVLPLVAGQTRRATRALPAALVASLLTATVLYLGIQLACVRALGDELARSSAPLRDAAGVYGGAPWQRWLTWGTSVSAVGISFGMVSMTPRYLLALTRLQELAPPLATPVTAPVEVPPRLWWVTWGLGAGLLLAFGNHLEVLVGLSSLTVVGQYAMTALALGTLAWRRRAGFGRRHVGWAGLALTLTLVLAGGATPTEATTAGVVLSLGWLLRRAHGARRAPLARR